MFLDQTLFLTLFYQIFVDQISRDQFHFEQLSLFQNFLRISLIKLFSKNLKSQNAYLDIFYNYLPRQTKQDRHCPPRVKNPQFLFVESFS